MMLFGTGLTLAVLMDATIVRATLVPAFMRLAGPGTGGRPRPSPGCIGRSVCPTRRRLLESRSRPVPV